jgi:hypothetical protein
MDFPVPSRPKLRARFAYGLGTLFCIVTAFCAYQAYRTNQQILKYYTPAPEVDYRPEVVPYRFTDGDFVEPLDPRPATVRLRERVEVISQHITELRTRANSDRATDMHTRLEKILESRDSGYPVDGKTQLHAIAIYGGDSHVKITYTLAPLVVALCAYDPTLWTIEADPGVQLKKVILAGYHQQRVQGVPHGVSVEGQVSAVRNEMYSFYASTPLEAYRVTSCLREITGLEAATFQTTYGSKGSVFRIGPGHPEWTASMTFNALEPLYQEAVRNNRFKQAKQLVEYSFPEVACTPGRYGDFSCSFATHSIFGPYAQTMRPVRGASAQFAFDARGPSCFSFNWREGGILALDLDGGVFASWPVKGLEIDPHREACLAFDTKRQRLLVWGASLYSIDILKKEATLVRNGNPGICALAYSKKDDLLYACCASRHDGSSERTMTAIGAFNHLGAEISRTPLTVPIAGVSWPFPAGTMKLTVVGDALLITHLGGYDGNHYLIGSDTNYVVDPKSGKLLFACRRKPR